MFLYEKHFKRKRYNSERLILIQIHGSYSLKNFKMSSRFPNYIKKKSGINILATCKITLFFYCTMELLSFSFLRYDCQTLQWSFVAAMNTPRSTVGVAVLQNKLYAVGGRDGSSCLNSVEVYDPHTNKWCLACPMVKRRGGK